MSDEYKFSEFEKRLPDTYKNVAENSPEDMFGAATVQTLARLAIAQKKRADELVEKLSGMVCTSFLDSAFEEVQAAFDFWTDDDHDPYDPLGHIDICERHGVDPAKYILVDIENQLSEETVDYIQLAYLACLALAYHLAEDTYETSTDE